MSAGERIEIQRIAAALRDAVACAKPGKKERKVIRLANELEVLFK